MHTYLLAKHDLYFILFPEKKIIIINKTIEEPCEINIFAIHFFMDAS